MASESVVVQSVRTILDRLIRAERAGLSAAAARSLLQIDFETADHERMHQLAVMAQEGTLTAEERVEIDAYGRVGCLLEMMHSKARQALKAQELEEATVEIPPGILRSQQAFWRDLPELLRNKRNHRQWAAYHGDEQIGVAADRMKLVREIRRRGISQDDYYIDRVEAQDQAPWEPIEVESIRAYHVEELPLEP